MKQKNNNKNQKKNIDKINNKIKKIDKDTDEMLLSKYIINEIDFIDEIYNVSLSDIDFIRSFFRNSHVKIEKGILKKINKYIDKETKDHIDNLVSLTKEKKRITIEELLEEKVRLAGYDDEDDPRDIIRMKIMFRRDIESELYFIASYLKEKLNKQFIIKRISKDNISLKLLVERYNKSLARLKYLFYCL